MFIVWLEFTFDSSGRRHTSFASCDVIPDFNNDEIEIEINQMISQWILLELQALVDNILTKLSLQLELHATGIVVNNQNERSQIKNRSCNENVEVQTLSIKVRRARARNG